MQIDDNCETLNSNSIDEIMISHQEYNDILNIQQNILEMLGSHSNAADILSKLCTLAESLLPNSVASVMLIDKTTGLMSVVSAPSVPQVGHDALANLKPGPAGGSCGNAVFHNEPQFVQDTYSDDRWSNLRQVAYDFNLCSCWSMPIRDKDKNAIGSFALSSFEHRLPADFHKKLLQTAASIVSIVLKNQDFEKRLNLFSTAAQNATEGMLITDKNNKIVEVNETFEKIYGYKENEVLNQNPKIFASGHNNKKFYKKMWESLHKQNRWSGEIINNRADGSEITQWMSITTIRDKNNVIENYLAVFSDLTELKNTQLQIEYMAFHDSLTKLHNKTYLEKVLSSGELHTLLLLNINNFSYINTAYGFEVGDKLLIEISKILKNNFNINNIFRINSDEFVLLFNGEKSITDSVLDIQNYFYNMTIDIESISINVSFTYGGAVGNKDLLQNGALALKQAKENGKNHLHIFNKNVDNISHLGRKTFIASNNLLHTALEKNRVIPYFQGIYDNKNQRITKYESLVRIIQDDKVISPYHFLEPARLSGLLPEITKIMIEKSFEVMSKNSYSFSINITEDDLSRNYLIDYLKEKSSKYYIEPNRLILEILEGVSSTGKHSNIEQLTELKALGYNLAIDDFGAEYSNFERVLDLDIDFLKIDAKYIKDIDKNPKSYEIARAISFFAKNANIPCVAEFVHNESVQNIIKDLGIDYSQGYYFSEPSPLPK